MHKPIPISLSDVKNSLDFTDLMKTCAIFFIETSGSQRSDGVQPSPERLAYQPLRRAQAFPRVVDVCMLCPGFARLHSDLSGVSDHNVSQKTKLTHLIIYLKQHSLTAFMCCICLQSDCE